jgi:hypothetical protein
MSAARAGTAKAAPLPRSTTTPSRSRRSSRPSLVWPAGAAAEHVGRSGPAAGWLRLRDVPAGAVCGGGVEDDRGGVVQGAGEFGEFQVVGIGESADVVQVELAGDRGDGAGQRPGRQRLGPVGEAGQPGRVEGHRVLLARRVAWLLRISLSSLMFECTKTISIVRSSPRTMANPQTSHSHHQRVAATNGITLSDEGGRRERAREAACIRSATP